MTVILMGDHGTRGDMEVNINKNYINETVNSHTIILVFLLKIINIILKIKSLTSLKQ